MGLGERPSGPEVRTGTLLLITPEQYKALPDGTMLVGIDGRRAWKGVSEIEGDYDHGRGVIAYGFMQGDSAIPKTMDMTKTQSWDLEKTLREQGLI